MGLSHVSCTLLCPVVIVAITALCLGYDAGVMSGAIGPIRRNFDLSDMQEGIVMGCINLIAAPGALVGGKLADRYGRVNSVAGTATMLLAGPVLVASCRGFPQLFVGRLVTGIGVGLAFVIAPLYAAEVSPPDVRAGVVAITEILINFGVMLGYMSAALLSIPGISSDVGWRIVTGLAAAPALMTLCTWPYLPESPRWLVQQRRRSDAEVVMERLCPNLRDRSEAMKCIEQAMTEEINEEGSWQEIFCASVVVQRMLLAGLGVAFFQQISGSEAIVYYTPTILRNFGLDSSQDQNLAAMVVGGAKLLGACFGACFLDRVGRRCGVIVSCLGVSLCLVGLASLQQIALPRVGLALLCFFMIFFELGLAPAAFVLGTESYPVAIRAKALGLGMFTTRFLSGLVAVLFPTVVQKFSLAACLWVFAAFGCLGVAWALLCVPETQGLTLEAVAALFEKPVWTELKSWRFPARDEKRTEIEFSPLQV